MKKIFLITMVTGIIYLFSGCGAYQGNIIVGEKDDNETRTEKYEKNSNNIMEELFQNDETQDILVRKLSDYDNIEIDGSELHAFIEKYKGDSSLAILVSTERFSGILVSSNGEGYLGTVGYENLPIKSIFDENGMYWGLCINYNAQYDGGIKIDSDNEKYYDTVGFVKNNDGSVMMYTYFEDMGIDSSYTEYIDGNSTFYATTIRNMFGNITGVLFVE